MNIRIPSILLVAALIGASPSASPHGRPSMVWEITSISAKHMQIFSSTEEGQAVGINNLGSMVGWARATAGGKKHAFKRDLLGATTDIGAWAPQQDTEAADINENSEVVGSRDVGAHYRAFYWSLGDGYVNLSDSNPIGVELPRSYAAFGINNHGRIVGKANTTSGGYQSAAVTWWYHGADPSLINPLPASLASWAWDVSDSSWFAGEESNESNGDIYGFRYRAGTLDYPTDPSPGTKAERVYGVNEAGTVVGDSWWPCCGDRAVRWRLKGDPLVLGLLPGGKNSTAYDINEQEFVVGYSDTNTYGNGERGFLFHIEFGMVALPIPEGFPDTADTNCTARALTDRKSNGLIQVAGHCTLNGKSKVVRWDVYVDEYPEP